MTFLRRFLGQAALLGVVTLLAGCHSYVPVERPAPGTPVRVRLPLRAAVEGATAAQGTLDLEGRVVSSGDSLVLETTTRRELGTFRTLTATDTVRLARGGILALEEQVFSKPKTLGLTALVVAGATGVVLAALEAAGGQAGEGRPGGNTPAAVRVPPLQLWNALSALLGR